MHDIPDTIAGTAVKVFERVSERLVIDQLFVHEDMAGKSGPLIGPRQVQDYLQPYYRYCVSLGREMLGLPPLARSGKGWGRMGF
ncbi:MAG: hypothetical protein ABSG86_23730 [Thermoguttaceae bacterium]|jgi:hypothetical protein